MSSSAVMRNNMMLGQLLTNDIGDKRILDAMSYIPREPFVPEHLSGAAYVDEDLDVGNGRFIMEPLTFVKLLDMAGLTPDCRALVIGALSGYAAAIVSKLAAHVVAVDTDEVALTQARDHMARLNISNVNIQPVKALTEGYRVGSPYNVIVVMGAITIIPESLGNQLSVNGRLVAIHNIARRPGMKGGLGKGLLVTRIEHTLQYRESFDASCPLLPGFEEKPGFAF